MCPGRSRIFLGRGGRLVCLPARHPARRGGTRPTGHQPIREQSSTDVDQRRFRFAGGARCVRDVHESSWGGAGGLFAYQRAPPHVEAVPVPLAISRFENKAALTWTNAAFALQAAPDVSGTFTNLPR